MENKTKYGLYLLGVTAVTLLIIYLIKDKKVIGGGGSSFPEKDPDVLEPSFARKNNFHLIPSVGKNNYRSEQMSLADLEYVIKNYNIKNIIRMNADGTDSKNGVTRRQEEDLCKRLGCNYTFINAHEGYVKNKGYTQSIKKTGDILNKGNTLIHCNHGADRTGGMVGSYLKNYGYMTDLTQLWNYTTKYNRWMSLIRSNDFYGSGFDKYADGFYPIDQLKLVYR